MITNDRQYKIAKAQIQSFQSAIADFSKTIHENVHPVLIEASKHALEEQLKELIADVHEYEALKAGDIVITEVRNLADLPLILIKARIANGLTQSDLAKMLEMKEQQIQRYESEQYNSTSLKTLLRIAELLNLSIHGDVQLKEVPTTDVTEQLNVNNYPFKEMFKRGFFVGFTGTMNEAIQKGQQLLFQLYDRANLNNLQQRLTRKTVRTGGEVNQFALDAWYARVVQKAKQQETQVSFNKEIITDEWLSKLAYLSRSENGPRLAADYLQRSGICFVTEQQLAGTYLDGAALLLENKTPIIALTLRHDRLDNFWFVLFHEIAHIKLHLGNELEAIFDDLDIKSDGIEKEADDYALNALIPNEIWKKSLVRFSPSKETIINQAEKLAVHSALVAGRIRRESGKYFLFNDLIGQGEVRKHFLSELNN